MHFASGIHEIQAKQSAICFKKSAKLKNLFILLQPREILRSRRFQYAEISSQDKLESIHCYFEH